MLTRNEQGGVSFGRGEYLIQGLIVTSLIAFAVETLPGLPAVWRGRLHAFEHFTIACFTVEYLARLVLSRRRLAYATSFFGIIDLAAILPFYLTTGIDLRAVRLFRLFRLIRLLKLARYNAAVRRFHRAFRIAKEEMILFGAMALVVFFLASVGIYYFERDAQPETFGSVFHAMWWSIATLTTVGFGDAVPITIGGKIFTFFVLIVGLGIVAVPTGLFASALSKAREIEDSADEADG